MTNKIIQQLEAEQMSKEIPTFAPGDTVVVQVKVKEGERSRLQAFEGVVIAKRNRSEQRLHRAQDLQRRWRRAYLPDLQPANRQPGRETSW